MKRIFLFIVTNIAVLLVISVIFSVFGVGDYLRNSGTELDLGALLVFSAIIGFTGSIVSLLMSKWMAKRMTGAHVITQPRGETESWLVSTVQRHARTAGIGMPEVAIYQAPEMNAFATGAFKNSALVAVSTGLLEKMTRDEVDAVLGHEISHVANGDMVTLTLIQGVVNTFVIFLSRVVGYVVDRAVFKTESGHGPGFFIVAFACQILFGILASTIVMWFSRWREFRADAGGAKLAGRERMIAALERLGGGAHRDLPDQLAAFGISGKRAGGIKRLFMSHPPISERIEALRRGTGM